MSYGDWANGVNPYFGFGGSTNAIDGWADASQTAALSDNATNPQCAIVHGEIGASKVATLWVDSITPTVDGSASAIRALAWGAEELVIHSVKLYSLAIFSINEKPTTATAQAIAEWTKYQHVTAGNKVICPYFLNRDSA